MHSNTAKRRREENTPSLVEWFLYFMTFRTSIDNTADSFIVFCATVANIRCRRCHSRSSGFLKVIVVDFFYFSSTIFSSFSFGKSNSVITSSGFVLARTTNIILRSISFFSTNLHIHTYTIFKETVFMGVGGGEGGEIGRGPSFVLILESSTTSAHLVSF